MEIGSNTKMDKVRAVIGFRISRPLHSLGDHREIIGAEWGDRKSDGSVFAVKITNWIISPGIAGRHWVFDREGSRPTRFDVACAEGEGRVGATDAAAED